MTTTKASFTFTAASRKHMLRLVSKAEKANHFGYGISKSINKKILKQRSFYLRRLSMPLISKIVNIALDEA